MNNTKNIRNDRDLKETIDLIEQEKQFKKQNRKERSKKFWLFLGLGIGFIVCAIALFVTGILLYNGKDPTIGQTIVALLWIPFFIASITMFGLTGAVATNRIK